MFVRRLCRASPHAFRQTSIGTGEGSGGPWWGRRFRVLDECDEMLNMGFVDDVEKILGAKKDKGAVQTLLFSATLPAWVKDITRRFLKPSFKTIDLVGNERMKVKAIIS